MTKIVVVAVTEHVKLVCEECGVIGAAIGKVALQKMGGRPWYCPGHRIGWLRDRRKAYGRRRQTTAPCVCGHARCHHHPWCGICSGEEWRAEYIKRDVGPRMLEIDGLYTYSPRFREWETWCVSPENVRALQCRCRKYEPDKDAKFGPELRSVNDRNA